MRLISFEVRFYLLCIFFPGKIESWPKDRAPISIVPMVQCHFFLRATGRKQSNQVTHFYAPAQADKGSPTKNVFETGSAPPYNSQAAVRYNSLVEYTVPHDR